MPIHPHQSNLKNNLIEILYEDDSYIVFNKPAGLLVIPTPKNEKRTLVTIINQQYADTLKSYKLHPCHRLDRDTSGVIIFAKGKKAQKLMMDEFRKRTLKKNYIAFVSGVLNKDSGEIKSSIKDLDQKKFNKNSAAKFAITRYKVIKRNKLFSIVNIMLITGRTNQIRIHFSEIGHPLIGETKYARRKDSAIKFKRTALHATALECVNPITEKRIVVKSEIPEDLNKLGGLGSK